MMICMLLGTCYGLGPSIPVAASTMLWIATAVLLLLRYVTVRTRIADAIHVTSSTACAIG